MELSVEAKKKLLQDLMDLVDQQVSSKLKPSEPASEEEPVMEIVIASPAEEGEEVEEPVEEIPSDDIEARLKKLRK